MQWKCSSQYSWCFAGMPPELSIWYARLLVLYYSKNNQPTHPFWKSKILFGRLYLVHSVVSLDEIPRVLCCVATVSGHFTCVEGGRSMATSSDHKHTPALSKIQIQMANHRLLRGLYFQFFIFIFISSKIKSHVV